MRAVGFHTSCQGSYTASLPVVSEPWMPLGIFVRGGRRTPDTCARRHSSRISRRSLKLVAFGIFLPAPLNAAQQCSGLFKPTFRILGDCEARIALLSVFDNTKSCTACTMAFEPTIWRHRGGGTGCF